MMKKLFCGVLGLSTEEEEDEKELFYHSKARKLQIKKFARAQQKLAVSHANYVESLNRIGSALLEFSNGIDNHGCSPAASFPVSSGDTSDDLDLVGIMNKVDDCFSRAADYGDDVSMLLLGWPSLLWFSGKKLRPKHLHDCTIEQIYYLEKKLCQHVKSNKYEKQRVAEMRCKKVVAQINKLRDGHLYCELLKHVQGLMCMWKGMYECHHEQAQIVHHQLLTYTALVSSSSSTTITQLDDDDLLLTTLQLERSIKNWMNCFCSLMASQRVYITSLTGWLRLISNDYSNTKIYSLCEDWGRVIDWIPDKLVKQGINDLLTTVRAIRLQQRKRVTQNKRCVSVLKKLEKERNKLWRMECKALHKSSAVEQKRAKVAALMAKAEEEKRKQRKYANLIRTMTLTNLLQVELPRTIQALLAFTKVCKDTFQSVYNRAKDREEEEEQ